MLIPKNTSNVIQCVTCGAENHKNISMQDCVKINNLFTKFVPDFTFQQIKDCENVCIEFYFHYIITIKV